MASCFSVAAPGARRVRAAREQPCGDPLQSVAGAARFLVHLVPQNPRSDQRRNPEGRLQFDARIEARRRAAGTAGSYGPTRVAGAERSAMGHQCSAQHLTARIGRRGHDLLLMQRAAEDQHTGVHDGQEADAAGLAGRLDAHAAQIGVVSRHGGIVLQSGEYRPRGCLERKAHQDRELTAAPRHLHGADLGRGRRLRDARERQCRAQGGAGSRYARKQSDASRWSPERSVRSQQGMKVPRCAAACAPSRAETDAAENSIGPRSGCTGFISAAAAGAVPRLASNLRVQRICAPLRAVHSRSIRT